MKKVIPELSSLKINNFWLLAALLFWIGGCGEGPPEHMPEIDRRFRTTPPSRIYFKNIRSTSYQWQQDAATRTDYYLLRKIGTQSPKPLLYPVIADIWMEDQAQLLLESGKYDTLPVPLLVYWQSQSDSGTYSLKSRNVTELYELGLQLYQSIQKGHTLEIGFPNQEKQPLLRDQTDRRNFTVSMQDYLRLTEFY